MIISLKDTQENLINSMTSSSLLDSIFLNPFILSLIILLLIYVNIFIHYLQLKEKKNNKYESNLFSVILYSFFIILGVVSYT